MKYVQYIGTTYELFLGMWHDINTQIVVLTNTGKM